MEIKRIGLIGAGAVGGMISSYLFRKYNDDFFIVASGSRAERYREKGLNVNGEVFNPNVMSERDAEKSLDLLIITVKNYHLEKAMEDIGKVISPETIILPLLNGVTATERLRERFSQNRVLYGIVMRTDAERKGGQTHFSVTGEIQLGYHNNEAVAPEVSAISESLETAGLKTHIYPDMLHMLWRKWMINIGANQVSMLAEAPFKYFGMVPEIPEAVRISIQEIAAISQKAGVNLTNQDVEDIVQILINYPPEKKSSMLQDFEAHRPTEIDYFAGTVVTLGKKYGIPTPVNQTLYYLIKARERIYLNDFI